jgi:hypothetical protein
MHAAHGEPLGEEEIRLTKRHFPVLAERGRRALRVRLGADVKVGLAKLRAAIEQALA